MTKSRAALDIGKFWSVEIVTYSNLVWRKWHSSMELKRFCPWPVRMKTLSCDEKPHFCKLWQHESSSNKTNCNILRDLCLPMCNAPTSLRFGMLRCFKGHSLLLLTKSSDTATLNFSIVGRYLRVVTAQNLFRKQAHRHPMKGFRSHYRIIDFRSLRQEARQHKVSEKQSVCDTATGDEWRIHEWLNLESTKCTTRTLCKNEQILC